MATPGSGSPAGSTGGPANATQIPEALVIEGSISLEVEEIRDIGAWLKRVLPA